MKIVKIIVKRIIGSPVTTILGTGLIILGAVGLYMHRDTTSCTFMITAGSTLVMMKDQHIGIGGGSNTTPPNPTGQI